MLRKHFIKRDNYLQTHENIGFQYHQVVSADNEPYWTEGVGYEFTLQEIEQIEAVSLELHEMCLEVVEKIIKSGDYPAAFGFSNQIKSLIEQSWKLNELHIYGRFDLLYDRNGQVKLYEYNADTPTSLLESAVAQWHWLEETEGIPYRDQFNSIHEKLVDRWKQVKPLDADPMLFVVASKLGPYEDWGNTEYIADTAVQGGWKVNIEEIENIGYNTNWQSFVDFDEIPIEYCFKLYPWEWMMGDKFGKFVQKSPTIWFEPPWKMLLSNKAILPVLWESFIGHPNLLPAYFENERPTISFQYMYVKKPILGREGANIHLAGTFTDKLLEGSHQALDYENDGHIYQEYAPLPEFDGKHPVIGSWIIGDEPAGIGIREDNSLVTGNASHFVPHYFVN